MKPMVIIKRGEDGSSLAYEAMKEMKASKLLSGRVLLKPNITTNMPASTGVTTHPSVVEGVIRYLREEGDFDLIIAEGGGCDISRAFDELSFADLAMRYDVRLVDLNRDAFVTVRVENPLSQPEFPIAKTVLECDHIVNLPCLKVHTGEMQVTLCMKNMMGFITPPNYRASIMHTDFNRRMMDLLKVVRPKVNLIDGLVGHEGGEIQGEPVGMKLIIASADFVAADAVGAAVMGFSEGEVVHIALAETMGFGKASLKDIEIRGESIKSVRRAFRRAR
ncbi:TPA: DUF362 domain-containing protein [Candidatus Poribacteria bacterium]|nr:DUF362 domain-containing protein [Candidatus Poribacteria bacterium]